MIPGLDPEPVLPECRSQPLELVRQSLGGLGHPSGVPFSPRNRAFDPGKEILVCSGEASGTVFEEDADRGNNRILQDLGLEMMKKSPVRFFEASRGPAKCPFTGVSRFDKVRHSQVGFVVCF